MRLRCIMRKGDGMKRVDISGFGGPYENACQTMLQRFIEWGKDKSFEELFPRQPNGKRKLSEQADKELTKLVDDIGPSGAMFWSTISHFSFIHKKGYDAWIKLGEKRNRIIDWNPENKIHFDSPEEAFERGRQLGEQMRKK